MGVKVVYRANKKAWYVQINDKEQLAHCNGRKALSFGQDKKAAQDAAREIAKALKLGKVGDYFAKPKSECITLREFAERWIAENSTRKRSTMLSYEMNWRLHLAPAFGDKRLDEITREQVKEFGRSLMKDKGLKVASARKQLSLLGTMLNAAVEQGVIASNPAKGAKRYVSDPDNLQSAEKVKALTREQVAMLLALIKAEYGQQVWTFYLLLARTGMRIGEALALQWGAVDTSARRIAVRRTLSAGTWSTPKNKRERLIDMSGQLCEALKLLPRGSQLDYVFSKGGQPLDLDSVRFCLYRCSEKLGYRISPHALRHTFASLLISEGRPIGWVSRQLGHSTIAITMDVYGHLLPSEDRSAVDSLDDKPEVQPGRNLRVVWGS